MSKSEPELWLELKLELWMLKAGSSMLTLIR